MPELPFFDANSSNPLEASIARLRAEAVEQREREQAEREARYHAALEQAERAFYQALHGGGRR